MNAVVPSNQIRPEDPSDLGWPPTLPVELALRVAPVKDICRAYGISKSEWDRLRTDPGFVVALADAVELVKKEGMSFRIKARLQAEELLKESWKMIHDRTGLTPPTVRADLIKFTIRAAGLDASAKSTEGAGGAGNQLNIQINL